MTLIEIRPSQRIGVNSVRLHRGHLPAVSKETGFVKRFTYRHSLQTHRIERVSCDCSIWCSAFNAVSRIASRAAFSGLSVESIASVPSAEACQLICAICAPRDEVKAFSCSYEHMRQQKRCLEQNGSPIRFRHRVYALPKLGRSPTDSPPD
jgi:hypothetical protein